MVPNHLDKKKIFLTFDDGIEDGTYDVLKVLEEERVPATFFLCGLNITRSAKNDLKNTNTILYKIARKHCIGNHSFSHCYGRYAIYYKQGLLVNLYGKRMAPISDFLRNEAFLNEALNTIGAKFSVKKYARLPGRNAWCYYATDSYNKLFMNCPEDTIRDSIILLKDGFSIFGWDIEWEMNFDFARVTKSLREEKAATQKIDHSDPDIVFPFFPISSKNYSEYDRLKIGWKEVAEKIKGQNLIKTILLMHDRAFRKRKVSLPKQPSETQELSNLIKYFKKEEYTFDVISNYLT
jgi:peptidoglycan/xylan/chitin deacetylase (PgdA/CDA1 family)